MQYVYDALASDFETHILTVKLPDGVNGRPFLRETQMKIPNTGYFLALGDADSYYETLMITQAQVIDFEHPVKGKKWAKRLMQGGQCTQVTLESLSDDWRIGSQVRYRWVKTWTGLRGFTPEAYHRWYNAPIRRSLRRLSIRLDNLLYPLLCFLLPNHRNYGVASREQAAWAKERIEEIVEAEQDDQDAAASVPTNAPQHTNGPASWEVGVVFRDELHQEG